MFQPIATKNIAQSTRIDFTAANITIVDHIETVLDYFGLDYNVLHNRVVMPCPVHNSSRESSLNFFTEGRESVGNWKCWSRSCEKEIGFGAINLVKFLLEQKDGPQTYNSVVAFLEKLTGTQFESMTLETAERRQFTRFVGKEKSIKEVGLLVGRDRVRENLEIPAEYYLKRGYTREILDKYDVGVSYNRGKPMFMRVVVPCYNEEFKLVGAVGRSMNEECPICGTYHFKSKPCPSNDVEKRWAAKWVNADNFSTGNYFYNLWHSKEHIVKSESVCLVEGQGEIWRLEEAGVHNALGLFGLELTDAKFAILAKLPVMNIFLALNSDEAGRVASAKIRERLERYYNVTDIHFPEGRNDIGEMAVDEVKVLFSNHLRISI